MNNAKVQLSNAEINLFGNADVILTKNHILAQTKALLEEVQQQMQQTGNGFESGLQQAQQNNQQ